ncbi:hypothetical protein M8J75_000650 [Diaphorina citri]|nr:hypothetical protein M8J75_000650 [Diaphorina citri]
MPKEEKFEEENLEKLMKTKEFRGVHLESFDVEDEQYEILIENLLMEIQIETKQHELNELADREVDHISHGHCLNVFKVLKKYKLA